MASHQRSRGSSGNADAAHSAWVQRLDDGRVERLTGHPATSFEKFAADFARVFGADGRPSVDVGADCLRVAAAMLSPLKLGTRRCYRAAL